MEKKMKSGKASVSEVMEGTNKSWKEVFNELTGLELADSMTIGDIPRYLIASNGEICKVMLKDGKVTPQVYSFVQSLTSYLNACQDVDRRQLGILTLAMLKTGVKDGFTEEGLRYQLKDISDTVLFLKNGSNEKTASSGVKPDELIKITHLINSLECLDGNALQKLSPVESQELITRITEAIDFAISAGLIDNAAHMLQILTKDDYSDLRPKDNVFIKDSIRKIASAYKANSNTSKLCGFLNSVLRGVYGSVVYDSNFINELVDKYRKEINDNRYMFKGVDSLYNVLSSGKGLRNFGGSKSSLSRGRSLGGISLFR